MALYKISEHLLNKIMQRTSNLDIDINRNVDSILNVGYRPLSEQTNKTSKNNPIILVEWPSCLTTNNSRFQSWYLMLEKCIRLGTGYTTASWSKIGNYLTKK